MPKTIAGALVGQALGAFGKKPVIPELPTLDTAKVQREAVAGNIAALPGLETLATSVNTFAQSEISRMLETALPGFGAGLSRATATANALARGEIPEDVSAQVQNRSAARSLGGGFGGTGMARALTARDLGLTSLSLQSEGMNRLLGLGGFARQTFPTFDFTTAFLTPQQKLTFDRQQNLDQFNRQLLANQVAAAPDPNDVALAEALDNFFETWKNVGMGMLGGGMGGGGGGMMGGGGGGGGGGSGGGGGGGTSWFGSGGGGGGGTPTIGGSRDWQDFIDDIRLGRGGG